MRVRAIALTSALLVLVVAGCRGPRVASPLAGTTRHLCCNLWYEKPKINDVGYEVGTRVPFGTRVQILEVFRSSVRFQPDGHPPIELAYKVNPKGGLPFETYLERLFVEQDPRAKLKRVPKKTLQGIEDGTVEPGMTRDQVLMAVGYPPAHMTPSLESSAWRYWRNRWTHYVVYFQGDKVERVN